MSESSNPNAAAQFHQLIGNAKYWFHRVGRPAGCPALSAEAARFLNARPDPKLSANLLPGGDWEPFAFVDACEAAVGRSNSDPQARLLREIQRIEFEALVGHLLASC